MGEFAAKVIRNTLFNSLGNFWNLIVKVLLTPYMVTTLGDERYGTWIIIGVMTSYFGLADLGLVRSFDKFLAEYHTREEYDSFNQVVNTGLGFYMGFAVLVIGVMYVSLDYLLALFSLAPEDVALTVHQEARFVFMAAAILLGWTAMGSVVGMVLTGIQRMDLINKISICNSIPHTIGTVMVLEAGYGLRGLIYVNGAMALIGSVIILIADFRMVPQLRLNPLLFKWAMFKKMFSFGTKLHVARLGNVVSFQLDRILISHYIGIGMVTHYSLGAGLTAMARNILLMLPSAVIPATSELDARKENDKTFDFYQRGTRYLVLAGTPVLLFIALIAPLLMQAWMGSGYERSALVIQILVLGYYVNMTTGVATGVAVGLGKPEFEMKFGIFLAVVNLAASLALIGPLGFYGPPVGSTIALVLAAIYFYHQFHEYLEKPMWAILKPIYMPPLTAVVPAALVLFVLTLLQEQIFIPVGRIQSLSIILVQGLLFLGIYVIAIYKMNYLDEYDVNLARRYLKMTPA